MAGHVTLAQVAESAGVSLATASRALNGSPGRTVRPDLAARVDSAAAALGYSVNLHAQSMARGSTTTVGLIVHDIADPHAAAIASGVMAAAAERDLIVTIASTLSDPALEVRHVRALMQQRARAVILAGAQSLDDEATAATTDALNSWAAAGGRITVIGQDRLGVNTLAVANHDGAYRLARTLQSLGYQRFAVLAGPDQLTTSEERMAGFCSGAARAGAVVPPENIISAQLTRDGGYAAMTELLDRELTVDCLFAVSDIMAVGAIAALRERGLDVPGDVAIAGFDGIDLLRDVTPSLTTVTIPLADTGHQALELAMTTDPSMPPVVRPVPFDVVVRDSTPAVASITA